MTHNECHKTIKNQNAMNKKANILYISSLGMSEPLGKSQVLEYLQDLSINYNIYLYSFEKCLEATLLEDLQKRMDQYGIHWSYQKYSNTYGVFSTLYQITTSVIKLIGIVKNKHIKIIHARSLIPVLIALSLQAMLRVSVIFDIRGFQTDEKAEVGRIKHASFLYKILKYLESYAYRKSNTVVTLTNASKKIISGITDSDKVVVIPTCANRNIFRVISKDEKQAFRQSLGYDESAKIIIHAGAVSNWYDFDSELVLIQELMKKNKSIHFLILNKGEHEFIINKLAEYNLDQSRVRTTEVSFYDMYKYLNIADASLFIIKPTFSKTASAPTKFAENLACGLFSITNNGIGDMNSFFEEHPTVGYSFDIENIRTSLNVITDTILAKITAHNCDNVKSYEKLYNKYLSKEMAIAKYSAIYDKLTIK
jgi:hypothetical protein